MSTWKASAANAQPAVPEELLPDVIAGLEKLETAFRKLEREISPDTPLWSGTEDEA